MSLTVAEQAFLRAVVAVQIESQTGRQRAWERLEADFGWPVAAKAWREARAEVLGQR